MSKITIKMQGGLGNQMFQYALAYSIFRKRNVQIYLDISSYGKDPREHADFQLQQLTANFKTRTSYRIWFGDFFTNLFTYYLARHLMNKLMKKFCVL